MENLLRYRYIVYLLLIVMCLTGIYRMNIGPIQTSGLTAVDVQEVYNNLQKVSGLPGQIPPVSIVDDDEINAWMTPTGMNVTTGMLKFLQSKDELAAVMGHEMGHFVLQHFQLDGDSRLHEANADKFGLFVMMRAGYNPCVIEGLWKRFEGVYGDDILTSSHPSPSQRADEMHFPMCHPFDY